MFKSMAATVIFLIIGAVAPCVIIADQAAYDEQEAIRRAAKQLQDIDNYNRKEAKKRADKAERDKHLAKDNDNGWGGCCCLATIIIIISAMTKGVKEEKDKMKNPSKDTKKENLINEQQIQIKKRIFNDTQKTKDKLNSLLNIANKNGFSIDEQEKKCQKCAEFIKVEAKVCRYCNFEYSDTRIDQEILKTVEKYIEQNNLAVDENRKEKAHTPKNKVRTTEKKEKSIEEEWFKKGREHHNLGEHEEAISAFSKAIEINKDMDKAYYFRAKCYKKLNDDENYKKDMDITSKLYHGKE